jgi:hypothetical protein
MGLREHAGLSMARARAMRTISTLLVLGLAAPALAGPCIARSGKRTTALVELYTGTRCAGCPAADRWLAELPRRWPADRLVPVALQVELSDYRGPSEAATKRRLSLLQRMALVYAPRVLLQGHQFGAWGSAGFAAAVERINARAARAQLQAEILGAAPGLLDVRLEGEVLDPAERPQGVLYLAAFDDRGPGALPRALEWQGPLAPRADGRFIVERRLDLLPGATPRGSGVVAFLQDRRTTEVLQAVRLAFCSS